jgi:hypothetical protein
VERFDSGMVGRSRIPQLIFVKEALADRLQPVPMKSLFEPAALSIASWRPAHRAGSETDLVDEMVALVATKDGWTAAQALAALRHRYPDSPLSTRLAALATLMKRKARTAVNA